MAAARPEWFRRTTWSADDRDEFSARLRRSRSSSSKAQYLRIQAWHLAEEAKPPLHSAAIQLLDQLLEQFPEPVQLAAAHLQRARSLAALDRPDEALGAYQQALQAERRHFGLRGDASLDYAELVLTLKRADLYGEALAILEERPRDAQPFPITQYRASAATAFLCDNLGRPVDAQAHATRALAASAKTESPFRYHRSLGLVRDPESDLHARLWKLAKGPSNSG